MDLPLIILKRIGILLVVCLITRAGFAQNSGVQSNPAIFDRIAQSMNNFKPDTSTAPDDKITRKIIELRSLRGGFNINEAIDYKIAEDRQKNEIPKAEMDRIADYF